MEGGKFHKIPRPPELDLLLVHLPAMDLEEGKSQILHWSNLIFYAQSSSGKFKRLHSGEYYIGKHTKEKIPFFKKKH